MTLAKDVPPRSCRTLISLNRRSQQTFAQGVALSTPAGQWTRAAKVCRVRMDSEKQFRTRAQTVADSRTCGCVTRWRAGFFGRDSRERLKVARESVRRHRRDQRYIRESFVYRVSGRAARRRDGTITSLCAFRPALHTTHADFSWANSWHNLAHQDGATPPARAGTLRDASRNCVADMANHAAAATRSRKGKGRRSHRNDEIRVRRRKYFDASR